MSEFTELIRSEVLPLYNKRLDLALALFDIYYERFHKEPAIYRAALVEGYRIAVSALGVILNEIDEKERFKMRVVDMSTFIINDLGKSQPYFRAYCLAKRLVNGDVWSSVNYLSWIERMQDKYRKLKGLRDHVLPSTETEQTAFEAWLFEQAEQQREEQDAP